MAAIILLSEGYTIYLPNSPLVIIAYLCTVVLLHSAVLNISV